MAAHKIVVDVMLKPEILDPLCGALPEDRLKVSEGKPRDAS